MTDTENDLNAPSTHDISEESAATTESPAPSVGDAVGPTDSTASSGDSSAADDSSGDTSTGDASTADSSTADSSTADSTTADSTTEEEKSSVPASAEGDDSTDAGKTDEDESGKSDDDSGDDDDSDDGDSDDEDDNPLETEAEIAADYLEELLDIADLDGDIDTYIEGDRAHVSIVSESDVLVGSDGHVLDALQELARLAVMTETGDRSRLMLDVAGYRDRRRKELVAVAADAVEEAKSSNDSIALAPMNPFERKIVHDAVAAAGLTSASEGEEPRRRVVVRPSA